MSHVHYFRSLRAAKTVFVWKTRQEFNSQSIHNLFAIKDSFTFVDWVKAHQHINEIMCSFDFCSLFTNVPLDETIKISLTKLYSLPDPPSLPRHVLKDLLLFATKKSHFVFDGDYYDQLNRWRRYGVSTRSSFSEHNHV